MLHKITLSGYEARLASGSTCGAALTLGTAGSYGVEQLLVTAAEDWQELSIRASFQPAGVRILISPGQVAEVPWEATQAPLPYPKGRIVFQGFAEGKLVTTCDLPYSVAAHSAAGEQAPQPPTPDEYEKFVQQVQADADRAEAAAGRAAQSADRAEAAAKDADASATQAAASAKQAAASASAAQGSLRNVQNAASKALSDINAGKNTALEAITHQKEDALSAVSQAQTDATGAVDTAQQEAVAAITHTGTAQTQAVTQAGEQAVQEVDAAAQAGVGSVGQAQQTATQAVQTAATAAIQRVEQTGSTQVQAVAASGAEQIKGIETTAAEKLEGITQLAGQAEDSATKAEQAAQRAEDAAAATSAIIDDTAITPAKTWSSLHILDALCPPIQATGNPVVCHPVEGYPLGVTVDFAPIQEGEGDPSPENVRPIKARESVDVVRCGENLLDVARIFPDKRTYDAVTFTNNKDGAITVDGVATRTVYFDSLNTFFLPAGTYTICAMSNTRMSVLRESDRTILAASLVGKFRAFTLAKNEVCDCFIACDGTFSNEVIRPCIVQGVVDTGWTQFHGDIYDLTLPRTIYGGTMDAVTGKGQETWKLVTLDGTENWRSWGVDFTTPGITGFYDFSVIDYDVKQVASAICSHFGRPPNAWGGGSAGIGFASVGSTRYLILSVKNDLLADTSSTAAAIDSLKAYLAAQYAAGTPVTVAYIKSTPTPITATGSKPIPALADTNTVLTDGDSLTVTGRADIVHALAEMSRSVTQNAQVVDAMLGINPKRLD